MALAKDNLPISGSTSSLSRNDRSICLLFFSFSHPERVINRSERTRLGHEIVASVRNEAELVIRPIAQYHPIFQKAPLRIWICHQVLLLSPTFLRGTVSLGIHDLERLPISFSLLLPALPPPLSLSPPSSYQTCVRFPCFILSICVFSDSPWHTLRLVARYKKEQNRS